MGTRFVLPDEFWRDLLENYWGRKPGVFRQPSTVPLASADDVFDVLVQEAGYVRDAGDTRLTPRFYLDDAPHRGSGGEFLAAASDGSLDGYVERMRSQYPGKQFALVLNSIHVLSERIWWNSLEVARGLAERTGQPVGGTDINLFLNHCERSAFDVHKDFLDNITFVIRGRKRFLTWPFEVLQGIAGVPDNGRWSDGRVSERFDYEPYRASAIVLEGEPGDVLYWPTSYWHVAESPPDSPLAVTVAFATCLHTFNRGSPFRFTEEVLTDMEASARIFDAPAQYRSYLEPGSDPAMGVEAALSDMEAFARRVLANPTFRREVEEKRLQWLTSFGYRGVLPPRRVVELTDGDVVRIDRRYPVVWKQYAPEDVVCSVHGHLLSCTQKFLPLLEDLNRGECRSVRELVERFADAPVDGGDGERLSRIELIETLQVLHSVRALRANEP